MSSIPMLEGGQRGSCVGVRLERAVTMREQGSEERKRIGGMLAGGRASSVRAKRMGLALLFVLAASACSSSSSSPNDTKASGGSAAPASGAGGSVSSTGVGGNANANGVGGEGTATGKGGGTAAGAGVGGSSGAGTGTPTRVAINEIMPSNKTVITDEKGGAADWIELANLTDAPIDLSGYFLSDKPEKPEKDKLPSGLVVPANGVLLLWADDDNKDGGIKHLSFKLTKSGGTITLSDPSGAALDSVTYADAVTDESYARIPNGTGAFVWCAKSTPGEKNGTSCGP